MSQQRVTRAHSAAEAAAEATAAIVDESVNNAASTAESTGANIVTPSKRNAAVAANVKPKKPKVNKYFYFKMAAGMEDAFVEGIQAANLHREEYGGLVEDERGFPYKKEFTAFKKQLQNPPTNGAAASVTSNSPSNASAIARAVLARMRNDTACDRFHGYFKTTSNSTLAVLVIRAINQYDTDTWTFRPQFLAEIFRNLAEVDPVTDILVHEAMTNFSYGKASNPDNADKNVVLTTEFTPKDDDKKTIVLDIYRSYTYFTIPVDNLHSAQEETKWLETATLRILRGIQTRMSSPAFKETLECLAVNRQKDYIKKLYNPANKTNLPKFLASAVLRADPARALTDHVIQSVSNEMMTRLYEKRLQQPKYMENQSISNSDDDDEESTKPSP